MCVVFYTLYICSHWIPEQAPIDEPGVVIDMDKYVYICETAAKYRLGTACPETEREHRVEHLSQGMCPDCFWKKIKE